MYWLLLSFITLVVVFWFTSKDRSPAAMIESIVSDFRSKGPGPFELEAFRGSGHGGHGGHGGYGGYGHGGGRWGGRWGGGYGGGYGGGWWPWYWPWYDYGTVVRSPIDPIPYPIYYAPLGI